MILYLETREVISLGADVIIQDSGYHSGVIARICVVIAACLENDKKQEGKKSNEEQLLIG